MRDVLHTQDGLHRLAVAHPDGHREARVIGSILNYLYAPDDPGAVIALLTPTTTPEMIAALLRRQTTTGGRRRAVD